MSIEEQQNIAVQVYKKLRLIDPHCILAGGAPRDWYFGEKANDLDYYFVSTASTINANRKQIESVFGVSASLLMDKEGHLYNDLYKTMPNLKRIWELEYAGENIQLIQLSKLGAQWQVVDNMDVSICKVWFTPERGIELHKDFKLTIASKTMFVKDGYDWGQKHAQKMLSRFKNIYYASTKEQAIDVIVNTSLKGFDSEY